MAQHIGNRITYLREVRGLKIVECAKAIGIHRATLSAYELGNRKVNSDWLPRLANFFGVSAEYLLGMREYEKIFPAHNFDETFLEHNNEAVSNAEFYIMLNKLTPKQRIVLFNLVDEMTTRDKQQIT